MSKPSSRRQQLEQPKRKAWKQTLRWIALPFVVILLAIVGLKYYFTEQVAAWFDDSWHYRTAHIVSNSGSAINDERKIKIEIDTEALIAAGKMQSDCDDARFTTQTGEQLEYFIDTAAGDCDTDSTDFYVKVPSVTAGDQTLFLYYGNPSAARGRSNDFFAPDTTGEGLVAYYPMDETTADTCSDGSSDTCDYAGINDGAWSGDATYTSTGKVGGGTTYDGTGDYVQAADNDSLDFGTGDFSISGWFKLATTTNDYYMIYDKGLNDSRYSLLITIDDKIRLHIKDSGTLNSIDSTTLTISDTNWHYIAVSADRSGNATFYLDGASEAVSISGHSAADVSSTDSAIIGSRSDAADHYFSGSLDDIRLYSRALDSDEITAIYNSGTGSSIPVPLTFTPASTSAQGEEVGEAPILSLSFDEGTGTTAHDASSNANHGTITGGATWQTESQCISGKCLYFDGSDDTVNVGTLGFTNAINSVTINTWVKLTGTQSVNGRIVQRTTGSRPTLTRTTDDRIICSVDDGLSSHLVSTDVLNKNEWFHISCTWGVNESAIKLYLNGKLISSETFSGTYNYSSNFDWYIGSENNQNTYFHGFIDEVRIYPYARTAAQIKADYNSRGTQSGTTAQIGHPELVSGSTLSDGLVAYYPMDETTANTCPGGTNDTCDKSGNGNDGAWNGDATSSAGKYGNGASFDGTGDYVGVNKDFNFDANNQLTFTTWVKFNSLTGWQTMVGQDTNAYSGFAAFYFQKASNSSPGCGRIANTVGFIIATGNGSCDFVGAYSNTLMTTGSWYHITATYDSKNIRIYVNGNLENTYTTNVNIAPQIGNLALGSGFYSDVLADYINGSLDEVRIYNRALSEAEVQALYNWAPGPVAHWKLDDNAGTSAIDSSGNVNTGALTNGPTWAQGKFGSAISLDGTDDYISLNNPSSSHTSKPSLPITGCAWVKIRNTSDYYTIISNDDYAADTGNYYGFILQVGTSGIISTSYGDGGSPAPENRRTKVTTQTIATNQWQHICGVIRGATDMSIYLNGIETSGTYQGTGDSLTYSNNDGAIGRASSTYFPGLIDDVQIYNYALTQEQIVKVMNGRSVNDPAVSSVSSSDDSGRPGQTVLHMSFDEGAGTTARDKSQYGNNGTLTNMASPATSTSGWTNNGKFGKALIFDNTNDSITVADSTNLQNIFSSGGTVSAWIYPNTGGENTQGDILNKDQAGNDGWEFHVYDDDGTNMRLRLSKRFSSTDGAWKTTALAIPRNQWTHVVATYNADSTSNDPSLYINGKLYPLTETSIPSGTASSDVGNNILIGNRTQGDRTFDGLIDEVKIYNYALSESEIAQEYNAGKTAVLGSTSTESDGVLYSQAAAREYCPPGDTSTCDAPVAEYKLDEGTGTSAQDTSGNANTGTLTNGPTWTQGKFGKALSFDGVDDYVSISDDFSDPVAMTVSLWFKTNAQNGVLFGQTSQQNPTTPNSFVPTLLIKNSGELRGELWTGSVGEVVTNETVNDNTWHHASIVGDTTNQLLYLDGRLVGTRSGTISQSWWSYTSIGTGYSSDSRGTVGGNSWRFFDGLIDNVRIYDYARTPAQIAWEYNRGAPVAWYKFDECQGTTINDWSQNGNGDFNGNNGTLVVGGSGTNTAAGTCQGSSGQAWADGADGKYNAAMEFDGVDDYVDVEDSSLISPGTGDQSVSAWVKTSTDFTSTAWIYGNYGSDTDNVVNATIGSDDKLVCTFRDGDGDLAQVKNSGVALNDNTYHHILCVKNGTTVTAYIDGVLIGSQTNNNLGTIDLSGGKEKIGTYPTTPGTQNFSGLIDDVRIYNYALTEEQVREVYNGGAAVRFE